MELLTEGAQAHCLKFVSWRRVEVEYVELQWLEGQGWEVKLNEVAARIDGIDVLAGGTGFW